jgi:hypothetical protein
MNRCAVTLVLAVALAAPAFAVAQGQPGMANVAPMDMQYTSAASIVWSEANIPGFDRGMKLAVISGKPDSANAPYTLRLSFPDGYRFPPHWHPMAENLTVLSGTLLLAMGERAEEAKLKPYATGDFLSIDGKKPHFGGARGATVIQLHGMGPFSINLVNAPPAGPASSGAAAAPAPTAPR